MPESASGGGYMHPRGMRASWGGCVLPAGVVSQHALRQTPPVKRMTDRCKNITLATTSLRPVVMGNLRDACPCKVRGSIIQGGGGF